MSEERYDYGWAKAKNYWHYYAGSELSVCVKTCHDPTATPLLGEVPKEADKCLECQRDYNKLINDALWGDKPYCPWCGAREEDWWDLSIEDDGDTCENECCQCGRFYEVTMHLAPAFSTEKVKPK